MLRAQVSQKPGTDRDVPPDGDPSGRGRCGRRLRSRGTEAIGAEAAGTEAAEAPASKRRSTRKPAASKASAGDGETAAPKRRSTRKTATARDRDGPRQPRPPRPLRRPKPLRHPHPKRRTTRKTAATAADGAPAEESAAGARPSPSGRRPARPRRARASPPERSGMDGARTRGHPAALGAVGSMIRGGAPHAVLFVGPAGVGKTTLALDLAAGLLCTADDPAARPCGTCRACRLVASGGHPDLHRIGPEGPGRQVVIGGPGARVRGIRDLIADLALLPVEGGARVAIVEAAHRMNEDAQAALLKTLEEPPPGVTLILCADAEEPLLPTIRSRCARLRTGSGRRPRRRGHPWRARGRRRPAGEPAGSHHRGAAGARIGLGAPAGGPARPRRAQSIAAGPARRPTGRAAGRRAGRRASRRRPSRRWGMGPLEGVAVAVQPRIRRCVRGRRDERGPRRRGWHAGSGSGHRASARGRSPDRAVDRRRAGPRLVPARPRSIHPRPGLAGRNGRDGVSSSTPASWTTSSTASVERRS